MQTIISPRWLAVGVILAGFAVATAQEKKQEDEKKPSKARVGQPAPLFELKATDGKTWSLADAKDKIVVLEWINRDCPVSRAALPTMIETSKKYAEKGVVWIAVDSTHYQTPEKMAEYKKENGIPYTILMDPKGRVGRQYGAKTTPHMYVINKGVLVYSGAIDNGGMRRAGDRNYVAETLDALLAGKEPPIKQTPPYGCSVKYARSPD